MFQTFSPDELETALRPVFNAVWNQEPEAYAFRQAVDPEALRIPVSTLYYMYMHMPLLFSICHS